MLNLARVHLNSARERGLENPSVFQIIKFVTYNSECYVEKLLVHFDVFWSRMAETIYGDAESARVHSLGKFFRSERISHSSVPK